MKKSTAILQKQQKVSRFSQFLKDIHSILWQNWLAIIVVVLGTWIRVHDLPNRAILFPDAGRDLLVAAQAVHTKTVPLLGIPSSVPRFKQGPLTIWLHMTIFSLAGYDLTLYSLVFACIGILAMILIYETGIVFFNRRVGLIALILIAFSPMAIAHSRMPYHTTPIPLGVIGYWWGLQAFLQKKKWGLFWAALSGAFLFQFELSMFPILLAIPILMIIRKHSLKDSWQQLLAGFGLGLLPQILSDLQNRFAQLGGFALWVGYRIASFFIPSEHSFGVSKVTTFFEGLVTYLPRLWAIDITWSNWLMLGILIISITMLLKNWWKTRSNNSGVLLLLFGLITVGYFVHGSPSEAYYPIYFVLLPLLIASGLPLHQNRVFYISLFVLMSLGIINLNTVFRHNFFVSTPLSYNYGPSYLEQQLIARNIQASINKPTATIGQLPNKEVFPSSFDHVQWVLFRQYGSNAPLLIPVSDIESDLILLPSTQLNNFTNFHNNSYQRRHMLSYTLLIRKTSQ